MLRNIAELVSSVPPSAEADELSLLASDMLLDWWNQGCFSSLKLVLNRSLTAWNLSVLNYPKNHNYIGHNYIGHNYIGAELPQEQACRAP